MSKSSKRPYRLRVRRLDHVAITVADLERSLAWYARVFGFRVLHRWTRTWLLTKGQARVGLFLRPNPTAVPDPDTALVIRHFCFFATRRQLRETCVELREMGIPFDGPEDSGIGRSIFLLDPDGHEVELMAYHRTSRR